MITLYPGGPSRRNPQQRTSLKDSPTQLLIKQAVDYLIQQLEAGKSETLTAYLNAMARLQRVYGLSDWYRNGALAEYVAVEARNLAPLPGDVDFTVGAPS